MEMKMNLKWLGLGLTLFGVYFFLPFSRWNFVGLCLIIMGMSLVTHAYAEDETLKVELW